MNAPTSITALLDEQAWMRRLARRLVEDESSADDLVQQAWLALLKRPPATGPGLRGFLATVLRRLASKRERGDARRTQRELRAEIAPREIPSPEELAAEVDAQRELVEAVLALDEPYRETVLLRWFRDLSTHGIAKHQGVPLGTVETRLKRAHARLREELTRKHDGDARRWIFPLMPVAAQATLPVGTSVLVTLGVLVMSKALFVAAAGVVAVSSLVWFGWQSVDEETIREVTTTSAPDTTPAEIVTERPAERLAAEASAPRLLATPVVAEPATCRVRVLAANGKPVPDASLAIERADSFTPVANRSNSEGDVEIGREPGTHPIWVISNASAPMRLEADLSGAEATLNLPRGFVIAGRIELDGRSPTESVTISFYPNRPFPALATASGALYDWIRARTTEGYLQLRATTDAEGRFEFAGLPEGFSGSLRPDENERYRVVDPIGPITLRAPSTDVVIRLRSTPRLRGRAVFPNGVPAPRTTATLEARSANGNYEMRNRHIRADGRFDIPLAMNPADKLTFILRTETGETAVREFVGIPDRDQDLGDVVLTKASSCRFRVIDEESRPISNAFAFLLSDPAHPAKSTGSDGLVEIPFPTLTTEVMRLCIGAEGRELVVVKSIPRDARTIDVKLNKAVQLAITLEPRSVNWPESIRFVATAPLANANDWAEAFDALSRTPFGDFFATAEHKDGELRVMCSIEEGGHTALLDHLPLAPNWTVEAINTRPTATTLAKTTVYPRVGELTPVPLRPTPPRGRVGRVLDVRGEPVRGAFVYASVVTNNGNSLATNTTTAGDGRFSLSGIFHERVDLTIGSPEFAPKLIDDVELGTELPELSVTLEPGRAVSIRVIDASGKPITDARVIAVLFATPSDSHPNEFRAIEQDGGYRFAALPVSPIPAKVIVGERTIPFTIDTSTNELEIRIPADG